MSILSGFFKTKRYRKTADGYKLESNWTSGNTVELDDGNTVQNNVGAIKGITTTTSVTEEGYAADATTVAALNNSLNTLYLPNGDIAKNLKFVIGECDVECTMFDNNIGLYCGSIAVDSLSNFHNDAFAIIPFACYNKAYYGYNGTVSLHSDWYLRVNSKYSCTMKVRCLLILHDIDS